MIQGVLEDGIATVTVARPEALNALDVETLTALRDELRKLAEHDAARVVVLTGAGDRAFIAGADIKYMSGLEPEQARSWGALGHEAGRLLETMPKPTIAAVNGFALGGGCELAMSCHIRLASDAAKFGQPESKLGLLPGYGGTQRLARLVGKGRANQLLLTGEMIDAAEAYRIGLVNKVVAADALMNETRAMMKTILANGPLAVALCIEAIDRGLQMSLEEGLILEANHFGLLAATDDMREGTSAFLEKRAPAFKGK